MVIGRALAYLLDGERVSIARDPCNDPSPAAESLRIRLRVFILAGGYAADEDAGLVLLTPCSLREQEDVACCDVARVG